MITLSPDRLFSSFSEDEKTLLRDKRLGIAFETQDIMEESLILLKYNCPDLACDFLATGWPELKQHTRASHGKLLWWAMIRGWYDTSTDWSSHCSDLCIRFKKIFSHEQTLYTYSQLAIHLPTARGSSAKQDQSSSSNIEIHPMCEFCREALFGEDEHFVHMRERHEECFICKRDGIRHQ